jgi:hypothetical protein
MATLSYAVATGRGLCQACVHEEGCIYLTNGDLVVLNCEQFELCPPKATPPPSSDQMELEKLWKKSSQAEPGNELKGLCVNCEEYR